MKLLFDENISFRLTALLADLYPHSEHVRNIGLLGKADESIWAYAAQHGFLLVSKDAIAARIFRLANGLAGDVTPIGQGVSELRIHYGPGYRIYFQQQGGEIIILLCGGDKASQNRDIETAKRLAKERKCYD